MSFEVEFKDEKLSQFLKNITNNLRYVKNGHKKFMGLMSKVVFADVMDHFKKQEGPDGKWEKWSSLYAEHMERIGKGGNKILQDNGALRQNFKPTKVRYQNQGIIWFNDAKVSGGFPYAFAHNEGSKKLPKREFMWASDKAVEDMSQQTLGFILDEGL